MVQARAFCGCRRVHLQGSVPPVDERGCTVPCERDGGYQKTRLSQSEAGSKSGAGCWRRSQSGIGPRSLSQAGGPRAGVILGRAGRLTDVGEGSLDGRGIDNERDAALSRTAVGTDQGQRLEQP